MTAEKWSINMSAFYRKKGNATSAFLKDRGFYIVLVVSLIMVLIAGYMAFTWNVAPKDNEELNSTNNDTEEGFDEAVIPTWPEDENAVVSENDPNAAVNNEDTNTAVEGNQTEVTDVATEGESDSTDTVSITDNQTDTVNEPVVVIIDYCEPCVGEITIDYSGADPVFSETLQDWRIHQGMDYSTEKAEDVIAAADGVVEDVYTDGLMGVTVLIKHEDGMRTIYQSLAINPKVLKGMAVKKGDIIGKTGDTASVESTEGTHLHFAMLKEGIYCDPKTYF